MYTGLNKRKKSWWKRRWFKSIITLVVSLVNPVLGAAVGIVMETSLFNKGGTRTGGPTSRDPSQQEETIIRALLQQQAIPTINNITESILLLKNNTNINQSIQQLNIYLQQIAVLQAFVKQYKNQDLFIIESSIAKVIEPLLAKMNTIITDVISTNNWQTNINKGLANVEASGYNMVGNFIINWRGKKVSQTYEKLIYSEYDATITTITPSLDDPDVSVAVTSDIKPDETIETNTATIIKVAPEKSNLLTMGLIGLAIFKAAKLIIKNNGK